MIVRQILTVVLDDVMFHNDPGDERLRRTVFGYEMSRSDGSRGGDCEPAPKS
jgi:nicotinamide N-methyltransferase